jgi:RNA polymerase sigma-70 factor (ECF subfamily)
VSGPADRPIANGRLILVGVTVVEVEPFRAELVAYCYRMLGSFHDAEDVGDREKPWEAYVPNRPDRAVGRSPDGLLLTYSASARLYKSCETRRQRWPCQPSCDDPAPCASAETIASIAA